MVSVVKNKTKKKDGDIWVLITDVRCSSRSEGFLQKMFVTNVGSFKRLRRMHALSLVLYVSSNFTLPFLTGHF